MTPTGAYRKALGQRVKRARKAREMTQVVLGERLGGYHPGTIANIEAGANSVSSETVVTLARVLRVDPGWLLTGITPTGRPQPPQSPVTADQLDEVDDAVARMATDLSQITDQVHQIRAALERHFTAADADQADQGTNR